MTARRVSAAEALARLRDGNVRFVNDARSADTFLSRAKLDEHLHGQAPYAIVLGCSDSRVPIEIVFDAGLGDLFVIRVAGNIVAPSTVGSIELAAEAFGPRLVVVLGHSGCGAVDLALRTFDDDTTEAPGNVYSIVEQIRTAIDPAASGSADDDYDERLSRSVRANVRAGVEALRHGSTTLERLIRDDGLVVVGAEYSLQTGVVQFFEGLPDNG